MNPNKFVKSESDAKEPPENVLDDLLDKINRLGYESLTPKEKEMLRKASKNVGKDGEE